MAGGRVWSSPRHAADRIEPALPPCGRKLEASDEPHLLVFGTGWGLTPEITERADVIPEPICGPTDYNHLSVRSAAAVILDRLRGARYGKRSSSNEEWAFAASREARTRPSSPSTLRTKPKAKPTWCHDAHRYGRTRTAQE